MALLERVCGPKELLNRWILPPEGRHDFLSLAGGKTFELPFEPIRISFSRSAAELPARLLPGPRALRMVFLVGYS